MRVRFHARLNTPEAPIEVVSEGSLCIHPRRLLALQTEKVILVRESKMLTFKVAFTLVGWSNKPVIRVRSDSGIELNGNSTGTNSSPVKN